MAERMMAERMKLTRLPRAEGGTTLDTTSGESTSYFHPHGWVIVKCHRTWSERVGAIRGASIAGPLTWWEVYPHQCKTRGQLDRMKPAARRLRAARAVGAPGRTLAEIRAWCDEHTRKGWTDNPEDATHE